MAMSLESIGGYSQNRKREGELWNENMTDYLAAK
jgi:hypothetical protein